MYTKPPNIEDVEQSMMNLYARITQKYLKERSEIPKGNLIEVRYEDFIAQPFQEIKHIYETLRLDGFQNASPAFQTYLNTQKTQEQISTR